MPRYDPDVIAALAEGRLDPAEAEALEREIAADPAASAELAAQRSALEAINAAHEPTLSTIERSDLRSSVAEALGISAPEAASVPPSRRVPWGSLGIAAAALAALVAVVPVVGLLSTDGGDDSVALELPEEVAPAAAEAPAAEAERRGTGADEAPTEEPVLGAVEDDDALVSGEAATDAASFGASTTVVTTTTVPATSTSASTAAEAPTTSAQTTAPPPPEGLELLTAELTAIREDADDLNTRSAVAAEENSCWVEDTDLRGAPAPDRHSFEYQNDEMTVIVYFDLTEGEAGPFQVWGVPNCADLVVIP